MERMRGSIFGSRLLIVAACAMVMARIAFAVCGKGCKETDEWIANAWTTDGSAFEPISVCIADTDCVNPAFDETCETDESLVVHGHGASGCSRICPTCNTSTYHEVNCQTWTQAYEPVYPRLCSPPDP